MTDIPINKPFKMALLWSQLVARFPDWELYDPDGLPTFRKFSIETHEDKTGVLHAPDAADLVAVQAVIAAHDPTQPSPTEAFRAKVVAILQSAVGVSVSALTTAQRNAVIVAMAYKLGAIDKNLVVQDPKNWL